MVLDFFKSGYKTLQKALQKSRSFLQDKLKALFSGKIDEEVLEKLEQLFYEADLGAKTSQELVQKTREFHKKNPQAESDEIIRFLQNELLNTLRSFDFRIKQREKNTGPTSILLVGANGNGKTTSIARLAHLLKAEGKTALLAAADTFRAGAQEQLAIWAERLGIDIVSGTYKGDPAAVAFDAFMAAKARGSDFLLIDTAGRLENKTHLMKELEKIRRTLQKIDPTSPHETLLVLDASIGQNGLDQALSFHEVTPLSGIVLTKMDGTAKGGMAFSIMRTLQVPVKFIGLGEGLSDFAQFEPESFVQALFSSNETAAIHT